MLTNSINNYYNKRQSIPQGTLQKTIKTTEASKKLFTHLPMQPTYTSNTVIRGKKDLKLVSKKCSGLYSVLSEKVQRTRQKLSTRAQYIGFSVVGKWKVFYAIRNPSAKDCFKFAVVKFKAIVF